MLERYGRRGLRSASRGLAAPPCATSAKPVRRAASGRQLVRGEVVGVDADGALVLDSGGRRMRFVSGEVSLRRPQR